MAGTQSGFEVTVIPMTWQRCFYELEQGRIDGIVGVIWSPERAKIAKFSSDSQGHTNHQFAIHTVKYSLYKRKDNPVFWVDDHLEPPTARVSAPSNYMVYQQLAKGDQLAEGTFSNETGLLSVQAGRMDAFVVSDITGDTLLQALNLTELEKLTPPIYQDHIHLVVSHPFYQSHIEQVEAMWAAIPVIKAEHGAALVKKYSLKVED